MRTVAEMRKNYTLAGLSDDEAGHDPFALFDRWFQAAVAAQITEPNAMILSTVSAEGKPSSRAVLLKDYTPPKLIFFSNYLSRKGREIATCPDVSLLFLWTDLERQIRIEGRAEKTSATISEEYFHTRPLGSRLGAWASPQSEVIPDRAYLEQLHQQFLAQYPDQKPPRPEHWGGYQVTPETFEFWQGRQNRLHDRIRFRWLDNSWIRDRLAP